MKAIAIVLALVGFSSGAMASKARVGALQGAFDVVDVQTTFSSPSDIHSLGQLMTFELGGTATTSTPKAEGGFLIKKGDAVWGAYLGHQNATQNGLRGIGTAYPKTDNPVDIFYGKNDWALDISLSQSQDVENQLKQTTVSAAFGKTMGDSKFGIGADVFATAENVNDTYTGAPIIRGFFQKESGDNVFNVGAEVGSTKQDNAGTSNTVKGNSLSIGALHHPMKEIYLGAQLNMTEIDVEGTKSSSSGLPVFFGIEKDVLSWATFRGSIKQNFLLGETKTATPTKTRNLNDTTVAVGLGIKHNNFTLDGTVAGSSTGKVDGNNVLTNASVTYVF